MKKQGFVIIVTTLKILVVMRLNSNANNIVKLFMENAMKIQENVKLVIKVKTQIVKKLNKTVIQIVILFCMLNVIKTQENAIIAIIQKTKIVHNISQIAIQIAKKMNMESAIQKQENVTSVIKGHQIAHK